MCMCVLITWTYMSHLYVFQFVIVGTYGETPKTDVAVDAVCIMTCKGKKLTQRELILICNLY